MADIPLIDVSSLIAGTDAGAMAATAAELRRTCEVTGFFGVIGHGVARGTVAALRDHAYAFFDCPLDQKMDVARPKPEQNRGYIGAGHETLARLAGNDTPPDIKEVFAMGPFDYPADAYHAAPDAYPSFAPNLWPRCAPGLEGAMKAYWSSVERLAKSIAKGFAIALDLGPDYFAPLVDRNTSQLRIMHYPAPTVQPQPGQLRAGEHTDLGMITILTADNDDGGLQVKRRGGGWIDVPVIEDAFVVNIGDLMMRWTNDKWVSTPHRVINPATAASKSRRLSIGYFFLPNYDTQIACLDTCRTPGEAPLYEPISVTAYRTARFASTAGMKAAS